MDISALMASIGRTSNPRTKADQVQYIGRLLSLDDNSFSKFLDEIPSSILATRFGRGSEDAYFTALFADAFAAGGRFDPVLCAIVNHLVLELTYQTRFLYDESGPESVLFSGPIDDFLIGVANHNVIFGVYITDADARRLEHPSWTNTTRLLEINAGLLVECRYDGIKAALDANLRGKVGLIVCVLSDTQEIDFNKYFNDISDRVTEYTSYVVCGPAGKVCEFVASASRKYPTSKISVKIYNALEGDRNIEKAIAVVQNINELVDIKLSFRKSISFDTYFITACQEVDRSADFEIIDYLPSEDAPVKDPFAIFTTAPMSEELQNNLVKQSALRHTLANIRNGYIVPIEEHSCHTYLHLTERGEVVMDYGNDLAATYLTQLWQDSKIDSSGSRHSNLSLENVIQISGAAMPLTFTPTVHQWFSHFMIQCFPRISILDKIEKRDIKILVPAGLRRKQLEMLKSSGLSDSQIIIMPHLCTCQVEELIVPQAWSLVFTPFTISIYEKLIETLNIKTVKPYRRVLISREARKTWRNMLNFEAVKDLLVEKHGFELVKPEMLSLREEIEIFRNAQIIVGAEGAGLYGSVYSQQASAVISISDEDYSMPILGSIAENKGFKVGYVFGESMRSEQDMKRRLTLGHSDFVVDPELVNKSVLASLSELL